MQYYVNPKQFKIYKNGVIKFGDFRVIRNSSFDVLTYDYTETIISSSHMPFLNSVHKTFIDLYLKLDIISLTPYGGTEIIINDTHDQKIKINDYTLKLSYASERDQVSTLSKNDKIVSKSESLFDLYNIALTA